MDPRLATVDAHRPEMEGDVLEVERREPGGDVRAGRVEGDLAEVEEDRVADDDVEPEGRHHEAEPHDGIPTTGEDPRELADVEGIEVPSVITTAGGA